MAINPDAFAALRCRNFRYFLMGQTVAMIGLWMKRLTMSWLVFKLTQSAFLLSVTEFLGLAPVLFVGAVAGAWLDQHDLKKTLIITQTLCLAQSLCLAALCVTHTASFPTLAGLALFLGFINAVDMPCRQSSVSQLVDAPGDLKSAIALHSMVFNTSRLVGPSVAGMVIYLYGETICFLCSAVFYLPILFVLLFVIRYRPRVMPPTRQSVWKGICEGVNYSRRELIIRRLFTLHLSTCVFMLGYMVLFPMLATHVLQGDSKLLGWMLSAVGLGALLGGIILTTRVTLRALPRWIGLVCLVAASGYVLFGFVRNGQIALLLSGLIGFGVISCHIGLNTLFQTVAEEDKRSRVLSLYIMCTNGIGPCGGLVLGGLADMFGAANIMLLCGGVLALGALPYLYRCREVSEKLAALLEQQTRP